MSNIIQSSIFDPLIPYIREIDASGSGKIKIELPVGLSFNMDAMQYFKSCVNLEFRRGLPTILTGILKDQALTEYLIIKFHRNIKERMEGLKDICDMYQVPAVMLGSKK